MLYALLFLFAQDAAKSAHDLNQSVKSIGSRIDKGITQAQEQIGALQQEVTRLRAEINQLKKPAVASGGKLALTPIQSINSSSGYIRLMNNWTGVARIFVNNKVYDLQPGADHVITIPSGQYVYGYVGDPPTSSYVRVGELRKIRVPPR